jgi:hypothetical protein
VMNEVKWRSGGNHKKNLQWSESYVSVVKWNEGKVIVKCECNSSGHCYCVVCLILLLVVINCNCTNCNAY